jgi:hypothetical protein
MAEAHQARHTWQAASIQAASACCTYRVQEEDEVKDQGVPRHQMMLCGAQEVCCIADVHDV